MTLRKPATTNEPVHELIAERWSPRSFLDTPIDDSLLISLFEAARWAPSCNNTQPWRFIVATKSNSDDYERAFSCLNERNQGWAGSGYVLGFVCAHNAMMPNGNSSPTLQYDTGMAMGQLLLQATAHGLHVHQMAGILFDKVKEIYGVPEDTKILCGFVIGYQGEPGALPEVLAEREIGERVREDLANLVFGRKYGETLSIVS
jgi:nitroreductase